MYQSHFCLSGRPFAAAPNPEHYFPAASIERARESLVMSIERAAGSAVVIGAVGTGKTLLCQLVANQFSRDLPVCMLSSARICTRRTLLQAVLNRLGLPIRNQDDGELRLTLTDHILGPSCPHGILLIVDEADRLPLELLEEIRVVTNLVQNGEPRVRLVLTGGIRLEERMGHPRLESLNQRIVARLYLENFTAEETADYVRARITACGGVTTCLFSDEALRAVYQATSGVPRLVNQVCDHALILASVGAHDRLDAAGVEEAWSDLQQLPLPPRVAAVTRNTEHYAEETINNVVEFGPLDDEADQHRAIGGQPSLDPSQQLEDIERHVASIGEETPNTHSSAFDPDRESVQDAEPTTTFRPHIFVEADAEETNQSFDDAGVHEDSAGQTAEWDEEELFDTDVTDPETDLTIDQATNPFDEEFAEEEVVIRQFALPSKIARRTEFQVVSHQSRELARQLTGAHPGFRMHPHQDLDSDDLDQGESDGFQPLTAYMHEADDPRAFSDEPGVDEFETEYEVTKEPVPRIVSSEIHTVPHAAPTTEGFKLSNPEVVIQFDHNPVDWADDPVMAESEMLALGPAPTYRSDEYMLIEDLQPEWSSRVAHQDPQPEVVSNDQLISRNVVSSAGFNPAIDQEIGTGSATPQDPFGPPARDVTTCDVPDDARPAPAETKPRLFRRLFSNLRRTNHDGA